MYLIVGLGNPGKQYENTRHNVGFDAVDLLVDEYRVPSSGKQHKAMYGKGVIAGQKVILAKPLTYMNLSGESVRALVDYYKIDPEEELIVIYDDISLDVGKSKISCKQLFQPCKILNDHRLIQSKCHSLTFQLCRSNSRICQKCIQR